MDSFIVFLIFFVNFIYSCFNAGQFQPFPVCRIRRDEKLIIYSKNSLVCFLLGFNTTFFSCFLLFTFHCF